MAADSLDAASSTRFVERLVQRDYEVHSKQTSLSFLLGLGCCCLGVVLGTLGTSLRQFGVLSHPLLTLHCTAQQPC